MEEESWRRNPRGGILEEESWALEEHANTTPVVLGQGPRGRNVGGCVDIFSEGLAGGIKNNPMPLMDGRTNPCPMPLS